MKPVLAYFALRINVIEIFLYRRLSHQTYTNHISIFLNRFIVILKHLSQLTYDQAEHDYYRVSYIPERFIVINVKHQQAKKLILTDIIS